MAYLGEFKNQISARNFPKFMQLWEEYCTNDEVDIEELSSLLEMIKASDFAISFGKVVESALPMWQTIQNKEDAYRILSHLIDLQTTNSELLAEIATQALKEKYGEQAQFSERLRLVGLRTKDKFQKAISNYDLLDHMAVGKFIFHIGGWGTGEIMELSPIRQLLTIEFENVAGRKHVTFENAFNMLKPLDDQHFLARRFADPDQLEKEAKENSVGIIKLLLKDLGPKTAGEIKDELCELVIPEKDWTKWWQNTRSKLKKDPLIDSPESAKEPFRLRQTEITSEELYKKAVNQVSSVDEFILSAYNFLRDLPNNKENATIRNSLKEQIHTHLKNSELTPSQQLQLHLILEANFGEDLQLIKEAIQESQQIEELIEPIEIIALKKRALILVKELRSDWVQLFIQLIYAISHSTLRDYMLSELNQKEGKKTLEDSLKQLLQRPESHPDFFLWYFHLLLNEETNSIPYANKEGQCEFFEAFLILLSKIENRPEYKDLVKKMYTLLSGKRYAVVRQIMEGASEEHIKEFLLLAAKSHTITDQDRGILRSLAAVVHPSLGEGKTSSQTDSHVIWATPEGAMRMQEKIKHIGTVEIVDNAREIEAARALGDLRENSEFKFAKERRARLTSELKTLSDQLQRTRVITKEDIIADEVGVGTTVALEDKKGKKATYTILGPFEADPEQSILSFQSKFAQAMQGCKKGDQFQFNGEEYKIVSVKSYLDK